MGSGDKQVHNSNNNIFRLLNSINCSLVRIIRPHRSTTYVDAAYSYRPSSVVCRSVGLSVTLVSPAKTAAPIELPFGLRTWVGPRNHVLDGGPDPSMGMDKFWGENGRPIVKYGDTLRSSKKDG